jgi:1-acyl-sn-glycerol-3-phosphate acyltransferase
VTSFSFEEPFKSILSIYSGFASGKEHALVISNHRSDLDWLFGWVMAQVCSSALI